MNRFAVALTGCCMAFAALAQRGPAPGTLSNNELDAAVVFAERDLNRAMERYGEKLASPTFSAGGRRVIVQNIPIPIPVDQESEDRDFLEGFSDRDKEELQQLYEAWEDAANRLQALHREIRSRCQADSGNPRLSRLCGRVN